MDNKEQITDREPEDCMKPEASGSAYLTRNDLKVEYTKYLARLDECHGIIQDIIRRLGEQRRNKDLESSKGHQDNGNTTGNWTCEAHDTRLGEEEACTACVMELMDDNISQWKRGLSNYPPSPLDDSDATETQQSTTIGNKIADQQAAAVAVNAGVCDSLDYLLELYGDEDKQDDCES